MAVTFGAKGRVAALIFLGILLRAGGTSGAGRGAGPGLAHLV
ncbi:hypothetical protein [Actinomadura logoneensis]|nr:hypothetical protein [Actinomadura logoneensis]